MRRGSIVVASVRSKERRKLKRDAVRDGKSMKSVWKGVQIEVSTSSARSRSSITRVHIIELTDVILLQSQCMLISILKRMIILNQIMSQMTMTLARLLMEIMLKGTR